MSSRTFLPNYPPYVVYVSVLPSYRRYCVDELRALFGDSLALYAGSNHSDPTVRTGIDSSYYAMVRNRFPLKRHLMLQTGHWMQVLFAQTAVMDLNPRNVTVWILTLARRILGRRTLHWGHLHPRKGMSSNTMWMRNVLRRFSSGTILYGYDSVQFAQRDIPLLPVWVAPNALYRRADLLQPPLRTPSTRTRITYVGRLVPEKKVTLLLRAFAASRASRAGAILTIVGDGTQKNELHTLVNQLGLEGMVDLTGTIDDLDELRELYADSVCSVSPGYAGLCLTQSLGFGVPVIVAKDEMHSPELELAKFGGVTFFESNNAAELANSIDLAWNERDDLDVDSISEKVIELYSAESMALGIAHALRNESSNVANTEMTVI